LINFSQVMATFSTTVVALDERHRRLPDGLEARSRHDIDDADRLIGVQRKADIGERGKQLAAKCLVNAVVMSPKKLSMFVMTRLSGPQFAAVME